MKKLLSMATTASNGVTLCCDYLSCLFAFGIRYYLAQLFIWSGYLKISSWQSTLFLFENEYKVPYLSPSLAAYLGTGAELILPIFILLGFGARISAIALFIYNLVMIISYPMLLSPDGACMLKDNILWGVLTAILIFYGPGRISLDYVLQKKVCPKYRF